MRPKRKNLTFDEESANKLFQEIYDESHNIKAKIARLFSKWETKIKENSEVAAIGDQIVKLIAAEAKNQDQKIILLKYLKEVVFDNKVSNNSNAGKQEDTENITTEKKSQLLSMVREELNKEEEKRKKDNQ